MKCFYANYSNSNGGTFGQDKANKFPDNLILCMYIGIYFNSVNIEFVIPWQTLIIGSVRLGKLRLCPHFKCIFNRIAAVGVDFAIWSCASRLKHGHLKCINAPSFKGYSACSWCRLQSNGVSGECGKRAAHAWTGFESWLRFTRTPPHADR